MRIAGTVYMILMMAAAARAAANTYVWWEAERSVTNNFPAPAA